jgi:tetratricopeptide (TPR) repeat protein
LRQAGDELFRLIKSMSRSEKGYFKKFSAVHSKGKVNKYLKLFNAIDKQREYDEKKVRSALGNKEIINQFHVAKNYLFKTILRSLNQYHIESTVTNKLSDLLSSFIVLYRRGLYKEANKILQRSKKLAYSEERYEFLPAILKYEKYLAVSLYPGASSPKLLELIEETKEVTSKIDNTNKFLELLANVTSLFNKKRIIRTQDDSAVFEKVLSNPLLSGIDNATASESRINYHQIFVNYNLALSNDEEIYKHTKKLIEEIEANPNHHKEFVREYISAINTLLISILFLKRYNEAEEPISKLKKIAEMFPYMKNITLINAYNFELIKCIQTGDFDKAVLLVPVISELLENIDDSKKRSLIDKFNYSISYAYFGAGNYDKALECLNKILNSSFTDQRKDLLSFTHILNLIIHFELKNTDLLEYIVKNTYRYLYQRKELYKVEAAILDFLKKTPRFNTEKELLEGFRDLKYRIDKITEDPYEKVALDYFNITAWLESKIDNKSFAEVVREKLI